MPYNPRQRRRDRGYENRQSTRLPAFPDSYFVNLMRLIGGKGSTVHRRPGGTDLIHCFSIR